MNFEGSAFWRIIAANATVDYALSESVSKYIHRIKE